jgi:GT2 family glycosyltransferase
MITKENDLHDATTVNAQASDLVVAGKPMLRLAVLLTCFNRRQETLACLQALGSNIRLDQVEVSVVVVDDGSTDGTADAVRAQFPQVQVVGGYGNLFWCRGMHKAFETALHGGYDYYLWLNDDSLLKPDAVSRLLECEAALRQRQGKPVIVVGSTVDSKAGHLTYGGEKQASKLRPTTLYRVVPSTVPQRCDSMNGNIVLIPSEIALTVGNLDPAFEHAMGDTDYALRARRLGYEVWVAPGIFGTCGHNLLKGTFMDASLPMSRRWKQMMSRKGLPWRSWLVLTRRHAGPLWFLYFAQPYIKFIVGACLTIPKK